MEKETTKVEAESAGEGEQQKAPTIEELQAIVENQTKLVNDLQTTNNRLLEESKANKSKYVSLRNEVEQKEKVKLEESENWKELVEIEKNNNFQLQERMKELEQRTVRSNINLAVSNLASDAHDPNALMKLINTERLTVGEDLSVSGIEEAIKELRENSPFLFKGPEVPRQVSGQPSSGQPAKIDWSKLSIEEKAQLAMNAAAQETNR